MEPHSVEPGGPTRRETAERPLEALAAPEIPIGQLDNLLGELDSDAERARLEEVVGDLLMAHSMRFVMTIATQHPDLDPGADGSRRYAECKARFRNAYRSVGTLAD